VNIINRSNFQAAFVNTLDEPKSERHICYYTTPSPSFKDNSLDCYEVYEARYPHPEAPDYADIHIILTRRVDSKSRIGVDAGHLVLLEAIQNDCRRVYGV